MKQYLATFDLYQRGKNDYVVEEIVRDAKTRKCISRHLFDVLVYDCCTVKGKRLYSWIPCVPSNQKKNESEIEI